MQPVLHPEKYVFCTTADLSHIQLDHLIGSIKEEEGISIILSKQHADAYRLKYDFVAAWISLEVYSDLAAVGLTAAVSGALAEENISCNVVAGYHHDHIFVPFESGIQAMHTLNKLSNSTSDQ